MKQVINEEPKLLVKQAIYEEPKLSVKQVIEKEPKLSLTKENVEKVLDEIRPYLVGTGGGELKLVEIDGPVVKVLIEGPAANVMTVRVAVKQKLREIIDGISLL